MYLRIIDFNYPTDVELISVDNGLLTLGYYSLVENKRYILQSNINTNAQLSIGTAPYGGVAIWSTEKLKSKLLQWIKADALLNQKEAKETINTPPRDIFDNYMKQFSYRYMMSFEHWDEEKNEWKKYNDEEIIPELDYIEEALFDGTHDKLHDGGLMNYHEAGKPKKLAVKWHVKKSEYTAYFWFEDEEIRAIFDRFYGAHPETKTDFMIRIDSDNKKFELAFYRYGLKEPQVISESAYQLLVFKNKFEYFRSENYNQPRGAWIW